MIVTCPSCFSADDVSYQRLPDRLVAYCCARRHDSGGPHEWVRPLTHVTETWSAPEGVTDELLEPMVSCIGPDDGMLEYGIVEYRLRERYPNFWRSHIAERGHVLVGHTQTTALAVRFGMALSRLWRSGDLAFEYGSATGAWSYNGRISYWCRKPAGCRARVTWANYCASIGRPADWTDEDRAAARC